MSHRFIFDTGEQRSYRLRVIRILLLASVLVPFLPTSLRGAEFEDLLKRTGEAMQAGRTNEALALVTQAIDMQPTNAQPWFIRGVLHSRMQLRTNAIADFDRAAKLEPKPIVFQHRGAEHFRAGNFDKSVADFDKFLELVPDQAPHHWQRGISLYYAGKFEEGAKQFESHKTVNPNDVENAVWHFLCVARARGLEKAKAALMPIEGDTRVPMKEIHALFAGKAKAEDVLSAAKESKGEDGMFYAHLYLGLYYEATGEKAKTREHLLKAARDFKAPHYMGDVARAHARLLEKS
jgi:lipoprotein NlpI